MAHRLLKVTMNHAQPRVKRPRIGITARGSDFLAGDGLIVCPATGAVRIRANFEKPEFQTTNTGVYVKLGSGELDTIDGNSPAGTWYDDGGMDHANQFNYWEPPEGSENTSGVGLITKTARAKDEGFAVGLFAYSAGNEQDGVMLDMGWSDTANATTGLALRFYYDSRVELWHDGKYLATRSMSGTQGYSRAAQQYVLITAERGRGQDLVVRTSIGGACTFRCDWVNPDDSESALMPDNKFWVYVPKGLARLMLCPIRYESSGFALTSKYIMAEPPGTGESLYAFEASDRFDEVDNAHLMGHPQGGTAAFALMKPDGTTSFAPNGVDDECRLKLTLNSGGGNLSTPWVWGVHAAYGPIVESTSDSEVDLGQFLSSAVTLSLPDSAEGLTADFEVYDLAALELAAPTCTEVEGTPVKITLENGTDDPVVLLDGEALPPKIKDSSTPESMRARFRIIDRLAAARTLKVREALPFDGMPFCRPVGDGISAVRIVLEEIGFDSSEMDLADFNYTMPDVPGDGDRLNPTGEWNCSANNGDLWGEVLDRLFGRVPLAIYGLKPYPSGAYKFRAFEPDDADTVVATVYRTAAAAIAAESITEAEAVPKLYDEAGSEPLPIEGNEARVTGFDPATRAPIAAVKRWADSQDPTLAPADRFRGWLGRPRTVEYGDPGLTRLEDCRKVCDGLYAAIAAARSLDSLTAQLPLDSDGIPVWRGDFLACDDWLGGGVARNVRVASWSCDLADESGQGDAPGSETPPSRIAHISGGALLGYGGTAPWEIIQRAEQRAKTSTRMRGFGAIGLVSAVKVENLT